MVSQLSELETEIQDSRTVPRQIQESDLRTQVTKASDVSRTDSDGPPFAQVSDVQLQRPGLQTADRLQVLQESSGDQEIYGSPKAKIVTLELEMQPQEKDHELKQLQRVPEDKETGKAVWRALELSPKEVQVQQLQLEIDDSNLQQTIKEKDVEEIFGNSNLYSKQEIQHNCYTGLYNQTQEWNAQYPGMLFEVLSNKPNPQNTDLQKFPRLVAEKTVQNPKRFYMT